MAPRPPGAPELGKDGLYVLSGAGIELAVEAQTGNLARLSLDGKPALLPPEPQPPLFHAEVEGSALLLKTAQGGQSKRIRLDTARRAIEITYTLTNTTASTLHASVADVLLLPSAAGLTFFPAAGKPHPGATLELDLSKPVVWLTHEQPREPKPLMAAVDSSEGWLASVHDGLVLVAQASGGARPLVSLMAPYDAARKERPFIELATRRELEILPGASASYELRLFLRALPPQLLPKSGNQALLGFVRGVIQ